MTLERARAFSATDARLDWISKHDTRSHNYRVAQRLGDVEIRPRTWHAGPTLNQGQEGACVGFGWTQELMTSPRPFIPEQVLVANTYAHGYYRECLVNDEYPGEADTGTSVLAGAQTAARRGFIAEYWWAMSIEEVRDSVIQLGPVVIGIPWYENMYYTRPSGLVEAGGNLVGGHCLLLDEYHPGKRLRGEDYNLRFNGFGWHNSWGNSYGVKGRGFIRFEDLRDLLATWGEACVPVGRKMVRF